MNQVMPGESCDPLQAQASVLKIMIHLHPVLSIHMLDWRRIDKSWAASSFFKLKVLVRIMGLGVGEEKREEEDGGCEKHRFWQCQESRCK